jgi:hypothetical protein
LISSEKDQKLVYLIIREVDFGDSLGEFGEGRVRGSFLGAKVFVCLAARFSGT